jgi:hypothetical protein
MKRVAYFWFVAGIFCAILMSHGLAATKLNDQPSSKPLAFDNQTILLKKIKKDTENRLEKILSEQKRKQKKQTAVPITETPKPAPEIEEPPTDQAGEVTETVAPPDPPKPDLQPQPVGLRNMIVVAGVQYAYADTGQASGQAWIDQELSNIGTWGGQPVNSVSDNQSTHFISHNTGAFAFVLGLRAGDSFDVYDATGQHRTYTVTHLLEVDIRGISADGVNHYAEIVGCGTIEQVVFQTCSSDTQNRIVFAR